MLTRAYALSNALQCIHSSFLKELKEVERRYIASLCNRIFIPHASIDVNVGIHLLCQSRTSRFHTSLFRSGVTIHTHTLTCREPLAFSHCVCVDLTDSCSFDPHILRDRSNSCSSVLQAPRLQRSSMLAS
uniref:Putative rhophilin-2 n=1 Tax=Ixodes ricinus TaxID=34613 RepID=A0A0K8RI64_IXORI